MIIVLFVISVLIFILGAWIIYEFDEDLDDLGVLISFVGFLGSVVTLVAAIILVVLLQERSVVGDKILMYQEENTKIEEQISEVVKQYQEYEKEIFTEVSPESSITLVSLYPELKSDTLVQKQIEVYTENNQKIKELKEEEIGAKVIKWWLYFGG
ncbi:MAG: hypothetical protein ACI4IT_05830 [Oscillospiraceae bacterium]